MRDETMVTTDGIPTVLEVRRERAKPFFDLLAMVERFLAVT